MDYELTGGGRWLREALDPQRAPRERSAEVDSGEPGTEPADSSLAHP
ncbi:hypothetical protein IU469_14300 [Nocardia puris]|nr:hypothetical protein [Nocardia puris]MBF6366887.1 hypothetical protein [Nocardia puris]